ncbi:MAG: arginyltransferase [Paracoccaceae bacterium]|jgi:arginyl-tRNA--protein-N-Asp/Glu arginylyltransferase
MQHILPVAPQFYVTAPQVCPYMSGRTERKLFTSLQGGNAQILHDALSKQGFRRSQNILYRPSCAKCSACMSARIRVDNFVPSRGQRRILTRNKSLLRTQTKPWATENQYSLFRRYLDSRHPDGGMADMDVFEFAAMIEETPVRSYVVEYTHASDQWGRDEELAAVCLTDVFDDGLSLVYSFYDPTATQNSLGTYVILDHIELAKEAGLTFVYLGYWVPGSPKMNYKSSFSTIEIYKNGVWQAIGDPKQHEEMLDPKIIPPLTEQLSQITMPKNSKLRI